MSLTPLKCPNCGADIENEERICEYCGTVVPLETPDANAPSADEHELNASLAKWLEKTGKNPNDFEAFYNAGLIYLSLQRNEKAIEYLEKAVQIAPQMAMAKYQLAVAYFDDGESIVGTKEDTLSKKYIDDVLDLVPDMPEALGYKAFAEGLNWQVKGDIFRAVEYYEKAVEHFPSNGLFQNNLAFYYIETGNMEKGFECYRKSIELGSLNGYCNWAVEYYEAEKYAECIELCERAIAFMAHLKRKDKIKGNIHNTYALALWKSDRTYDAMVSIDLALQYCPDQENYKKDKKLIYDSVDISKYTKPAPKGGCAAIIILFALLVCAPLLIWFMS